MDYKKLILFIFLLLISVIVLYQTFSLPEIEPQNASSEKFSANNAFRHLKVIAQGPRRMYQPHYERVKNYLIDELAQLGYIVEIQNSTALEPRVPYFYSGVENIIATIKGTSDKEDAILLVAHLDSEPHIGPGAVDNGGGVATLLEIARSLKNSKKLQNDVILLFSVPEECGMQGVVAFVKEHPLAKRVKLVLNCDGMGTGRLHVMNISLENNWLVAGIARAYPGSMAYSYISASDPLASREDLVFRLSGYPTIDFTSAYFYPKLWHSKHDDLNLITLSGLQENGNHLVSLINHFGNLDLNTKSTHESVFFSILNLFIIHYPKFLLIPSIIITVFFSIILLWRARKQRTITKKGIVVAFLTCLTGVFIATVFVKLLWFLITEFHPLYQFLFKNGSYNKQYFYLAFIGVSIISIIATFLFASRGFKITLDEIQFGVIIFLNACAVGIMVKSPHFVSVLLWVIISMQMLLAVWLIVKKSPGFLFSVKVVCVGLAVILLLPVLVAQYLSEDNELFRYASAILITFSLFPFFYESIVRFKKIVVTILGIMTLILLVIPLSDTFRFGHPQVTYVSCIADADRGQSFWYVRNLYKSPLDEYSRQFVLNEKEQLSIRQFIPDYPADIS